MVRVLLSVVAFALMITGALAQQEGARAYFFLPDGTNILSLDSTFLRTDVGGSTFGANVVTPSYQRSIDIGGDAGTLLIGIPFGNVTASFPTQGGTVEQQAPLAQGDLFVGGELGLVGLPALAPMAYVQYKPGLQVGVAAKLFLPTGNYDSSRLPNLGGNRWSLHASLPITYVLGNSMVDPRVTTFEIVPSVHIFGDNDDPFGPASVSGQAPVWAVEGHVTHNFNPAVWAALDGYYEAGGETSSDGVANHDAQQSLSLGATLGLTLSRSLALRLSYTNVVYSNVPDLRAQGFELVTAFSF